MTDLPDRIWCDFDEETMDAGIFSVEHFAGDVEYLRADTLPSRDEWVELLKIEMFDGIGGTNTPQEVADAILARFKGKSHD